MNIALAPDGEHYRIGDRLTVPRVTHVLKTLKLQWYPDDEAARALGDAAHLGIRYLLEKRLDWATVDPLVEPRVRAAEKFCSDMAVKPVAIETPVVSNLGYAGKPDLICRMGSQPERCVVDWCTGKIQRTKALQTVAYAGASSAAPMGRMGVELKEDGTYAIANFPPAHFARDWRAWLGAMALYSWVTRK